MFCPQCGAPNEDDVVFCGNCGAVLDEEAVVEGEVKVETEVEASDVAEEPEEVTDEAAAEVEAVGEDVAEGLDEPSMLVEAPPPSPPPTRSSTVGSAMETSGMAIASLVLGIAGWTLLPVLGSILAVILGYMARNEIRQRPDEIGGDGLALAGIVLGWLMIGASVLMICLGGLGMCFFFGLVGASGSGY